VTRLGQGCAAQCGPMHRLRADKTGLGTQKAPRFLHGQDVATNGGGGRRCAVSRRLDGARWVVGGGCGRRKAGGCEGRGCATPGVGGWARCADAARRGDKGRRGVDGGGPPRWWSGGQGPRRPPAVEACRRRRGGHPADGGCRHPCRRRGSGWDVVCWAGDAAGATAAYRRTASAAAPGVALPPSVDAGVLTSARRVAAVGAARS